MQLAVAIEGSGVAAACCAQLLRRDGIVEVHTSRDVRATLPALMVSSATLKLLNDVFPGLDLFTGATIIRKRNVLWGESGEPVTLPHFGVALSEHELLERIWSRVEVQDGRTRSGEDWHIFSGSNEDLSGKGTTIQSFGSRSARVAEVELTPAADLDACWAESVREGWLFLLPVRGRRAVLIGAGPDLARLLAESRMISSVVGCVLSAPKSAAGFPRISDPLYGPRWLACGTAAIRFDPLCGEGAGNAVREAILAAAVVRKSTETDREGGERLLVHFASRLLAGFYKHLEIAAQFYREGGEGQWWRSELASLERGLEWTQAKISLHSPSGFRLNGFDIESVSSLPR